MTINKKENIATITKKTKLMQAEIPRETLADSAEDYSSDILKQLNREAKEQVAYNLGAEDAPTNIKRWISTGSVLLDYVIANRKGGGLPEGRIVEIQGPPSTGKSHIMFEIAKSTQRLGGVVAYIDTENATSPENLKALGLNVSKNFIFIQSNCTEDCFKFAESIIMKAREIKKDIPVTIIWDSVAGCSPKAELEGEYEDNSIGLQARVLSKGMRKISNVIANQKVLFVIVNQQRTKIGVMYGNPMTTPGGMAIPYAASVRLEISAGSPIKTTTDGKEEVTGISVKVKTIKNKTARPFRAAHLDIIYGKGVVDDEHVFDVLRQHCEKGPVKALGKRLSIEGTSGNKTFNITDDSTGEVETVKFYKSTFREKVLNVPEYKKYIDEMIDDAMVIRPEELAHISLTPVDLNDEEVRKGLVERKEDEE